MFEVLFVGVFDSEIIDNACEAYGLTFMFPKSRCDRDRCISMWLQELDKPIISNAPRLWEAIHAVSHLDICTSFTDEAVDVVFLHDALRDELEGDAHIHVVFLVQGCSQVEILQIDQTESCIWCGKNTVELCFDRG